MIQLICPRPGRPGLNSPFLCIQEKGIVASDWIIGIKQVSLTLTPNDPTYAAGSYTPTGVTLGFVIHRCRSF